MWGLFLDDERKPAEVTWIKYDEEINWVVVRNYKDFLAAVSTFKFEAYSLDHDLQDFVSGVERTGQDCLKALVYELDIPVTTKMYFHTQNIVGRENMKSLWVNYVRSAM